MINSCNSLHIYYKPKLLKNKQIFLNMRCEMVTVLISVLICVSVVAILGIWALIKDGKSRR
ncbi:MAG: hypothetical protein PWQ94_357 [Thermoanaerobacterium sp.]|nr:hypothetical protein [Thermoanaerobacterium sp.]